MVLILGLSSNRTSLKSGSLDTYPLYARNIYCFRWFGWAFGRLMKSPVGS